MSKNPGGGFTEENTAEYRVEPGLGGWLQGFEQYTVPCWDGEQAVAVANEDLVFARELLTRLGPSLPFVPDAAPGADGSICMEWVSDDDAGSNTIFVDVAAGGTVLTYARLRGSSPSERHFGKDDPALIAHLRNLFDLFPAA